MIAPVPVHCFSITFFRYKEMKFHLYGSGHMTKMAVMQIYDKTPKNFCSPEPVDGFPCNLVCSIGNSGPLQFVSIILRGTRNLSFVL